jgi:hypothetical protein
LSDPRLSQLFALSSQLEALAHTIELEAAASVNVDEESTESTTSAATSTTTLHASQKPPELPPKPKFGQVEMPLNFIFIVSDEGNKIS